MKPKIVIVEVHKHCTVCTCTLQLIMWYFEQHLIMYNDARSKFCLQNCYSIFVIMAIWIYTVCFLREASSVLK